MKGRNRSLRLALVIGVILGWDFYPPAASSNMVLADNPPPLPGELTSDFLDDPGAGGESERYIPNAERAGVVGSLEPSTDRTVGAGCTYASIGAAITAANQGDRLLLEGGRTFNEDLSITKDLTIEGGYTGCASGSSEWTTIDGTGSHSVVRVDLDPPESLALHNLNITGGNYTVGGISVSASGDGVTLNNVSIYGNIASQRGGGLSVSATAVVTGTNVTIRNNTSMGWGGGVALQGGHAVFYDSEIHSNSAPLGAGVYGAYENSVAPRLDLLSYADIHDNVALTNDGYGGGVYMSQGYVTMMNCSDISSNDALIGGGAYLIATTLTMEGSCSEISYNTATMSGGGVFAQDSTVNLDDGAELYGNDADGDGGGAYLDNSDLLAEKAGILYNTAGVAGGGIRATKESLFDMDLGSYACSSPRCSQLSHNTAGTNGGGVSAIGNSEIDLRQTMVENNMATSGAGIYASLTPVFLYNAVVAHNNATSGSGDGIYLDDDADLTGSHNTIAYNDAGGAATGTGVYMAPGSGMVLSNSIVWGHTISISSGATVSCSDIQGGWIGSGNLAIAPFFVDHINGDFHLLDSSFLIDQCSAGERYDFENQPRPVALFRPATPYDMGADEVPLLNFLPLLLKSP